MAVSADEGPEQQLETGWLIFMLLIVIGVVAVGLTGGIEVLKSKYVAIGIAALVLSIFIPPIGLILAAIGYGFMKYKKKKG